MVNTLQESFGAVYALFERPKIARRAVAALLFLHTCLLAYSAYIHSATLNEPAHLVAGLGEWKFGLFNIYNVNPPLVKMVAALPVIAAGYNENWRGFYGGPGARPEMGMGEDFVAANGERSFVLFMIARWACMPFSWIGAIVCYLWARDLYGRSAGVLASTIWCFEPNILAHASLITPDSHASALGIAASYTFWRWLKRPTWSQAALTGVVLGLAELAKTTLIVLLPLWPAMWLIYRWPDRRTRAARDWIREAAMVALRLIVAIYVLNLGYGFEGSFQQLKQYRFVSDLFTGAKAAPASGSSLSATNAPPSNRFANSELGKLLVPFPKNYVLGIDIQQRDFEDYGRRSYLRGEWRDHGWWYFYLYACAVKVPLGLWLLGLLAVVSAFSSKHVRHCALAYRDAPPRILWRDQFMLVFPAIVILVAVSSKTGFSEHMRYVLPALPYFFIAASQAARMLDIGNISGAKCLTVCPPLGYTTQPQLSVSGTPSIGLRNPLVLLSTTLVGGLSWLVASSLWLYPHSLSYFNEYIGGPLNGPKYLLSSNVDWGQDLRYLKSWERRNISEGRLLLAYFGGFDPGDVGFANAAPLPNLPVISRHSKESISHISSRPPREAKFVAISVSLKFGLPIAARDGSRHEEDVSADILTLLNRSNPFTRCGYSILLYDCATLWEPKRD
jgi:4-amino-4-deoxy-L-arabinose transferase-like glycosyltransferase